MPSLERGACHVIDRFFTMDVRMESGRAWAVNQGLKVYTFIAAFVNVGASLARFRKRME